MRTRRSGGIVACPHPGLKYGPGEAGIGEHLYRPGSQKLELGGGYSVFVRGAYNFSHPDGELFFRDASSPHHDPLGVRDDVRREVRSGRVAYRLQGGG